MSLLKRTQIKGQPDLAQLALLLRRTQLKGQLDLAQRDYDAVTFEVQFDKDGELDGLWADLNDELNMLQMQLDNINIEIQQAGL